MQIWVNMTLEILELLLKIWLKMRFLTTQDMAKDEIWKSEIFSRSENLPEIFDHSGSEG